MLKSIVVLVSGGGTNLQALLDAQADGRLHSGRIVKVISDQKDAYALVRARDAHIEIATVERKGKRLETFEHLLLEAIGQPDLIILAGFLTLLSPSFIARYPERIINVHPSLIPSFCGKGYYGIKVHQAALAYGVKVTGATVHYVNDIPDGGRILMQKAVAVRDDDTPQTLQRRVMEEAEWQLLWQAAEHICEKE
ncbi:MAG: phosphoribosylglycinamide formyltransferase [Sphaerochaetaceae bacterium]